MKFEPGTRVRFVESSEAGVVIGTSGRKILVRTDDGFDFIVNPGQIVKEVTPEDYDLSFSTQEKFIKGKLSSDLKKKKKKSVPLPREMEIDLHIYELVDSTRNLTNGEMLQIQLKHFRGKLQEAFAKKMTKIVFIHGVGEGVLRSEILHHLRNYENVEVNDADYRRYGYGATEVKIYYK